MHFIVDGHNLIPKVPGLSLRDLEDERQLIRLLQEYCRLSRNSVEVYFDRAAPGSLHTRQYGTVKAYFARSDQTADQAIIAHLRQMGKTAANCTVVSSDHYVQNEARAARAQVMTSETFARQILKLLADSSKDELRDVSMKEEELSAWLKMFGAEDERNA
jgi:predicted RNA-binding protein with PIN domain